VVQWQEGEDQPALLARADKALYRAKAAGKNAIAE
jgi:PleD family two-component response regulator